MSNARKEIQMTGYLTHDAHLARLHDLRLLADARRTAHLVELLGFRAGRRRVLSR
jgi:hypothetical protein